jgi:probable FeS assembly SUF system protein SufT
MNETITLKRECEVIAIPSGRRETLPQGTAVRILQSKGDSYTVSTERYAMYRIDQENADALGFEVPSDLTGTPRQNYLTEQLVWEALKTIYDPELPVNIVDLGLVYSCTITANESGGKTVAIRMAMTAPGCGMSDVLKADAERKLKRLPEVTEASVEVVFDPPWDPSRMSESARLQTGMDIDDEGGPGFIQIERSHSK